MTPFKTILLVLLYRELILYCFTESYSNVYIDIRDLIWSTLGITVPNIQFYIFYQIYPLNTISPVKSGTNDPLNFNYSVPYYVTQVQ